MANENITDALSALKTILAGIDPAPQPDPVAVYHYPADFNTAVKRAAIDYTKLPLLIVTQRVNQRYQWRPASHGTIYHAWGAEVVALLHPGPVTSVAQGAAAEEKHVPWLRAMQLILFQNQGLSGTVTSLGTAEYLFDYQIGHVEWDGRLFWGIDFLVPVMQEHSYV